jgi:protein-S-isoprenylcysteine O-methyltransferase Ste14
MKRIFSAITKYIIGFIFVGAFLFLPAWTFNYFGAWLFMAVLFIPILIMGIVLFLKSPELLEKRLNNKEKEKTQKGVIALSGLMFSIGFVVSALDFRFSWSRLPMWLMITAAVLFLVGYALFAEVTRENAYLSRTVEVQDGQKVVSTGLYGIVRHPMYTSTIVMFLAMPMVLGSLWAAIPMLLYIPIIAIRIQDEEQLLHTALAGYTAYCAKVRWRLMPLVW